MKKMIEAAWLEYVRLSVPDHATQLQREDLRQTFFTGAAFVLAAVTRYADNAGTEAEVDDTMDALHEEIVEWGNSPEGRSQ
jgi:hypothetical protein